MANQYIVQNTSLHIPRKKKKICRYRSCKNTIENSPHLKFFVFPKATKELWIEACQKEWLKALSDQNLNSNYFVCERHFVLTDFQRVLSLNTYKRKLNSKAIPSCNEEGIEMPPPIGNPLALPNLDLASISSELQSIDFLRKGKIKKI